MNIYKNKYLKYKEKYLNLKYGGSNGKSDIPVDRKLDNNEIVNIDKKDWKNELVKLKKKLDSRAKNYLVIYAKRSTDGEKIRFSDSKWIFWDNYVKNSDGINGRFNFDNLKKISPGLKNSFDFITFDWYNKIEGDQFKIAVLLYDMLKKNGKLIFNKRIIDKDFQELEHEEIGAYKVNSKMVPFGTGYGGNTLLRKILSIIYNFKNLAYPPLIQSFATYVRKQFKTDEELDKFILHSCYNLKTLMYFKNCKRYETFVNKINSIIEKDKVKYLKLYHESLKKTTELWKLPKKEDKIELEGEYDDRNTLIIKKV